MADDDVFVSFDHLAADLLRIRRAPGELLYWGQLFWRPFYNNESKSVAEKDGNMRTSDAAVVRVRRKLERCREALEQLTPQQRTELQALSNRDLNRNLSQIRACAVRKVLPRRVSQERDERWCMHANMREPTSFLLSRS